MARIRDPARDKAKELWLEAGGENAPKGILKEIAEKLNVSEGTIRGWKAKDKWSDFNKNETERSVKNMERSNENNKKKLQLEESDFEYVDDDGLTDKQRLFCHYYMQSFNAYQAAIKAGYSENYAKGNIIKLLENESVKSYIQEKMKEIESERIAKAEEVLAFLSSSLRGEVLEEVISTETIDGMIKPVILKKQLSAKDRIKAAELLGKRYALFTEKVDLEGNVGVTIIDDIGNLEDA